jgi:hypothetical protein
MCSFHRKEIERAKKKTSKRIAMTFNLALHYTSYKLSVIVVTMDSFELLLIQFYFIFFLNKFSF